MQIKSWDKYEGQKLRPTSVSTGIIMYQDNFEIRCNLFHDQLKNKQWCDSAVNILKENNLL